MTFLLASRAEKELRVLQVPCSVGHKEGIWVRKKILVWGDLWSLGFLH